MTNKRSQNFPLLRKAFLKLRHASWRRNTLNAWHKYETDDKVKMLQLGAGQNYLKGWFNTDYFPRKGIYFLDVTQTFPFPSNSFDYVYSEHHIEHISYKDASNMLKEIYRVLKPGGCLRIATPNLVKYLASYFDEDNINLVGKQAEDWIYSGFYAASSYVPVDNYFRAHFVNDIFFNYDHRFIYDLRALRSLLTFHGFSDIKEITESRVTHQVFDNVISHDTEFDKKFTLCVEARK